MGGRFLLMFNHTLLPEQEEWAREHLGADSIMEMSESLKEGWAQVPSTPDDLSAWAEPFLKWINEYGRSGDLVLIQGDFGATYMMVRYTFKRGLVPVYATTMRHAIETRMPDGRIKLEHEFRFCRFRKYAE